MRKGGVLGSTPASGVPDRALAGWFHGAPLQKRAGYTERLKAVSEALTVAPEAGAIPSQAHAVENRDYFVRTWK